MTVTTNMTTNMKVKIINNRPLMRVLVALTDWLVAITNRRYTVSRDVKCPSCGYSCVNRSRLVVMTSSGHGQKR